MATPALLTLHLDWSLANINQGFGFKDMVFGQAAREILKITEPEPIDPSKLTLLTDKEIQSVNEALLNQAQLSHTLKDLGVKDAKDNLKRITGG